jgi:DNA polymerase elongation subunit (family B)
MRFLALDIETDSNAVPVDPDIPAALDPRAAAVVSVAVWDTASSSATFLAGDEYQLLRDLDDLLSSCDDGVLATWNGANFDLPFLDSRFARHNVQSSLELAPATDRPPKYCELPGRHPLGYWARWNRLRHLDVAYPYQDVADDLGVTWSLKPVAKALGIKMVEVDSAHAADLTPEQLEAYNVSDVAGTAQLAARLQPRTFHRWCDPRLTDPAPLLEFLSFR